MVAVATTTYILVGLCGLFSMLWAVCLVLPSGWHLSTVLFVLKFETSLYQVHVTKIVDLDFTEDLIPSELSVLKDFVEDTTTGTFGLQEMRSMICEAGSTSYCNEWSRLVFCSWTMLLCGSFIVICYWLAAGFLAYFWHANPTTMGLKCSRVFLIVIPIVASIVLALYFRMTLEFGDSKTISGMDSPVIYGPAFYLCVTMVASAFVPILIFEKCGINQIGENEAYEDRLKKYFMGDPLVSASATDVYRGRVPLPRALAPPSPYLVHGTSRMGLELFSSAPSMVSNATQHNMSCIELSACKCEA